VGQATGVRLSDGIETDHRQIANLDSGDGYTLIMEPIPETLAAINELNPFLDDAVLLDQLTARADRARTIAPDCIGVSVASLDIGVTFTLVATSDEIAVLDAVQDLTEGPCEEVSAVDQGLAATIADPLMEDTWQAFSRASAAAGVQSTVTFPVIEAGLAVGSVNLYGGSENAFAGRHEELAAVFEAWAPGAVVNADLSFSTRGMAEQAPRHLRDQARVEVATGIVAAIRGVDVERAHDRLQQTSQRAGVPMNQVADIIIMLNRA